MAGTFQVLLSLLFMLSTAAGLSFKDFGMDQIDESCSRPIPSGPQKGKSYEERLVLAFSDARQIARETFLGNFQQSKAFTRYFQSQDYPQARRMFLQIVDSFTDSSQDRIQVACGDDKIPECKPFGPTAPLGFLEAQVSTAPYTIPPTGPSDNTLRFCDSFFDGKIPFLARNLEDQRFNQDGWCKGSGWSTAFDFRVPGVEIISLLTHLDRGSAPPINEPYTSHATPPMPYNTFTRCASVDADWCPWSNAQTTKWFWDAFDNRNENPDKTSDILDMVGGHLRAWNRLVYPSRSPSPLKTVESSSSYAFAALEYYFLAYCPGLQIRESAIIFKFLSDVETWAESTAMLEETSSEDEPPSNTVDEEIQEAEQGLKDAILALYPPQTGAADLTPAPSATTTRQTRARTKSKKVQEAVWNYDAAEETEIDLEAEMKRIESKYAELYGPWPGAAGLSTTPPPTTTPHAGTQTTLRTVDIGPSMDDAAWETAVKKAEQGLKDAILALYAPQTATPPPTTTPRTRTPTTLQTVEARPSTNDVALGDFLMQAKQELNAVVWALHKAQPAEAGLMTVPAPTTTPRTGARTEPTTGRGGSSSEDRARDRMIADTRERLERILAAMSRFP